MKITANDGKTYTLPTNPVWHKGPPPEIGWWPASSVCDPRSLRWYDQNENTWSAPARPTRNENEAEVWAMHESVLENDKIMWTDRWWLKGGK